MDELYKAYQDEIVGILGVHPQYFKGTLLKKHYLDKKHGDLFDVMQKSYDENGVILHELLFANKNIDSTLYFYCTANIIHTDKDYFNALERYAIDEYKRQQIFNLTLKLSKKEIDLIEYNDKCEQVNKLGAIKGNRLTADKIITTLRSGAPSVKFKKFKNLMLKAKIKESDLVILAGKTSAGKTAFSLNLLKDLSTNYPCIYFNLEMNESDLISRLAAMSTNIAVERVSKIDVLPQNGLDVVKQFANNFEERKIDIVSDCHTLDRIEAYVNSYDNKNQHFIVFVDHMDIVSARGKNAVERTTNITLTLRRLSKQCHCTIFSLSQLGREETKNAQKPNLSMLKNSSEKEQSARKVLFVWEDDGRNMICIEKNDSGALATIPVTFVKDKQIFNEIEIDRIRE